jgi:hypothetical protein
MTQRTLSIRFSPPLVADIQWPLSNVEWWGVDYDFVAGRVSKVHTVKTQSIAFDAGPILAGKVQEFVANAVSGTAIGAGGYNPLLDPNPMKTLAELQANISEEGGDDPAPVALNELTQVTPMATFAIRSDLVEGSDAGGIRIPAGTPLTLHAELSGSAADLEQEGLQEVMSLSLTTPGIELRADGKPIAMLQDLKVHHGGQVEVRRFEALGKLKEAAGTESGLRKFWQDVQILALGQGVGTGPILMDLNPRVVGAVSTSMFENALTGALHNVITEYHDAIPGVDLRTVLGVKTQ